EQGRHILAAIAQGRKLQVNYVQAVVKILAKPAFAYKGEEIDVGGGDDTNVHLDLLRASEPHELTLLNDAEQLGLRFRTDGGNFVEENSALIGDFEETLFGSDGAGESAPDVAEELRFEQIHGDRASVDRYKGFVRARRSRVDSLGDELLAGAAFAADQHGRTRRRHLGDQIE